MERKGIDVSRWQKDIDWEKVKASGIEFAMLRCGGYEDEMYMDTYLQKNVEGCHKNRIPFGFYYMLPRTIFGKERDIVSHIVRLIGHYKFDYPIALDVELQSPSAKNITTPSVKKIAKDLESKEYYVSIYSSSNLGFQQLLNQSELSEFDFWVAQWSKTAPSFDKFPNMGMWQYTDKTSVDGIHGNVDGDIAFKDYPNIMQSKGLNNHPKPESTATDIPQKTLSQLLRELADKCDKGEIK